MRSYKRVLVVCDYLSAMGRYCMTGAAAYAEQTGTLELHLSSPENAPGAFDANIDGVLMPPPYCPQVLQRADQLSVPIVVVNDLDCFPNDAQHSMFYPDEQSIGKLAAEHFIERGFKSLAYCGQLGHAVTKTLGDSFAKALRAANLDCMIINAGQQEFMKQLHKRVLQLPGPLGVLAFNDIIALDLSYSLRQAGLTCPSDVALMGVDNDELLCRMGVPPLTSIDINWTELGYRAAQHLDALMSGDTSLVRCPVQPKGVVLRASTDCLAIPDPKVVQAICYIRQNASIPFSAEDVLAKVLLSRATLDTRFKRFLGHTVAAEIIQTRLTRAKKMLAETDDTIEKIAFECGFNYADHLFKQFKRQTGMTPHQYRTSMT